MVEIINNLFKYSLLNGIDCSLYTFNVEGDKFISIRFEKKSYAITNVYTYTMWTQFTEEQMIWTIQHMLEELERRTIDVKY